MTVMKTSDLLKAADTHANRPAATAVPVGGLYSCTTHSLIYRSDGTNWATWATLGSTGGGALKDFAQAQRTSGDLTLSSTTFTNVDTALDLTMTAATGDIIEAELFARCTGASNPYVVFDFHTVVAGSPVNSITSGTTAGTGLTSSHPGFGRAKVLPGPEGTYFAGKKRYALQAGDISSGTVTLRLRVFMGSSTLVVASDPGLFVQASNLGPQI